jgi:hypothetical protein
MAHLQGDAHVLAAFELPDRVGEMQDDLVRAGIHGRHPG